MSDPRQASGFSLVEMMISITIGLIIISALVGVLVTNSQNAKTNERTSEVQENGRYALDHLRSALRHAGYRGYTWGVKTEQLRVDTSVGSFTNECLDGGAAGGFATNLRQAVWGANDSNPFAANCLATAPLRGDVLVVRRVGAPLSNTALDLVPGNLYLRSTYAEGVQFIAGAGQKATQGSPAIAGVPLADFLVQEYVYYIGSDDTNANLPALRRISLNGTTFRDEEVVAGIENLQIQFIRFDTALNAQSLDADQIVGTASSAGFTDWEEVVGVRLWLLARNSTPEPGYTNTTSYQMGDQTYTVNDGFRRQLFTTVVQLRNTD